LALELGNDLSFRANARPRSRLSKEILALTQRLMEHVKQQRYAWAAADGRQLRFHHLPLARRLLNLKEEEPALAEKKTVCGAKAKNSLRQVLDQIDSVFPPATWRDLEQQKPLTAEQDATLREVVAQLPPLDPAALGLFIRRKRVLAALAGRDPSLAY